MLSENAIRNIGFMKEPGRQTDHLNRFSFEADQTNLLLTNDPVTAIYELHDRIDGRKLWQGPLLKPKSLIRKLIQFGNNVPEESNG